MAQPLLLLQVHASHDLRVLDAVRAAAATASPGSALSGLTAVGTRASHARRHHDRLTEINHAREGVTADAVLEALALACPELVPIVLRAYACEHVAADVASATAWLQRTLEAAAAARGKGAPLRVRAHAHPRTLERALADALDPTEGSSDDVRAAGGPTTSPPPLRSCMARWDVLACLVDVEGRWHVGIARGRAWGIWWSTPARTVGESIGEVAVDSGVICRAQRKLAEVASRVLGVLPPRCAPPPGSVALAAAACAGLARGQHNAGGSLTAAATTHTLHQAAASTQVASTAAASMSPHTPHADAIAIDLGAAPGGWCAVLAQTHACVIGVDPGALRLDMLPPSVVHVPARAEAELARLMSCGLGGRVSTLTCDANVPCATALAWVTGAGAALLAPGGALVLTLKNFEGGVRAWREKLVCVEAELEASGYGGPLQRIHLFSNAPAEVTIVAWRV